MSTETKKNLFRTEILAEIKKIQGKLKNIKKTVQKNRPIKRQVQREGRLEINYLMNLFPK